MSRSVVPDRLADQREDEWLGDALDRECRLDVTDLEEPALAPTTQIPNSPGDALASAGM